MSTRTTEQFAVWAGTVTAAIGCVVLVGWALDSSLLKSIGPGPAVMRANTALSLILSGVALILVSRMGTRMRVAVLTLAAMVALLGAASLIEGVFSLDFGIDEFLVRDASGGSAPGRMAILSAISLISISASLAFATASQARLRRASAAPLVLVLPVALAAVLVQLNRITLGILTPTGMAFPTGVSLILLSLGILSLNRENPLVSLYCSGGPGGRLTRRMLPMALVAPAVLGWIRLLGQDAGLYTTETGTGFMVTVLILIAGAGVIFVAKGLEREDESRGKAERALVDARNFLDSAFENIPNMVFVKDAAELRFVRFNKAGEDLLGFERSELLGKNDYDFFPKEQADFFTAKDRAVLEEGKVLDIPEEPIETRRRGRRLLHTRKMAIFDAEGRPAYLLGISEDITIQKMAGEQAARAQDAALELAQAKADFVANMSHELRTPLNAIVGMTEILEETRLDEKQRRYAETMRRSCAALLSIINQVLDFSKAEAGRLTLESIDFDLKAELEATARMFGAEAEAKGVTLRVSLADSLPRMLRGDPARLRQVVLNLVGNALKFTQKGSVDFSARPEAVGKERVVVRLEISDTGIGIAAESQPFVFEPFRQAESSTSRRFGGSGLGLSISRRIVDLMGGEIGFESVPGEGSTFWVRVPFLLAPEGSHPLSVAPVPQVSAPPRRFFRILLVDDEAVNREVTLRQFERLGYGAQAVSSGSEALAVLSGGAFDLVLLDCHMAGMDGFKAARDIRRLEPEGRRVPIVGFTADGRPEIREKCTESGMDGCLLKPVLAADLKAMLDRWDAPLDEVALGELRSLSSPEQPDFVSKVAGLFLKDAPGRLERLRRSALENEPTTAAEVAHGLRSSSGLLGAKRLAGLCAAIEEAGLAGRIDPVSMEALEEELPRVCLAVKQFSEEGPR